MASSYYHHHPFTACKLFLIISSIIFHFHIAKVYCVEYEVNGEEGWTVPIDDSSPVFNNWASRNRFQVDDTIRFKYKNDSVLEVTEGEYERCEPSHPQFFSNNGDTVFKLDRPGFFYFISGVAGHCQNGQKMIIKVLETDADDSPPPSLNPNGTTNTPPSDHSAAATLDVAARASSVMMLLVTVIPALGCFT